MLDKEINISDENNEKFLNEIPKLSATAINITTPENITYTEPMSGYYPATYGFENDTLGGDAKFWTHDVVGSTHAQIVDSYKGHNRVYELFDNAGGNPDTYTTFKNQSYGIIELWFLVTLELAAFIDIRDGVSERILVRLIAKPGDQLFARIGAVDTYFTEFGNLIADEWYHLRIGFRVAGAPECMELSEDSFVVNLNGIKSNSEISMQYTMVQANKLLLTTGWTAADPNYYLYFDAVGYSWDPNYIIGDNLYEGLLLSYANTTNLDWIGYSLNGQPNKTILGNTVIPLYSNGDHSIRVYGRNTTGYTFESPVRYYSIDIPAPQIFINSPQNGDNFGLSAPNFNISISTPILDTIWYTMDNGTTKIIFIGLSGTINQIEWDKLGFESVTIQFYINDTFGQESYSVVTINKNSYSPLPLTDDFLIILIISMVVGIIIIDLVAFGLIKIRKKKIFNSEKKPKVKKVKKEKSTGKIIIKREEISTYQQYKVCPFCKYELKVGYTFCIHCGAKLK